MANLAIVDAVAPVAGSLATRPVAGGGREVAAFLGPAGGRVFAVTHLPLEAAHALVICGATYSEQLTSYRTDVLLARWLADRGVAVVRFHYRGTGNSDDPPGRFPTFDTMTEDAELVTAWLRTCTGPCPLAYSGSRLGALIAARCVSSEQGPELILLEPALTGRQYFRELFRARRAAGLRNPGIDGLTQLEHSGEVDAFGNRVGWPTYASFRDRSVEQELGAVPRAVLLVQLASAAELRNDLLAQSLHWAEQGFEVSSVAIRQRRSWWFIPEAWESEETRPETTELLHAVAGWLMARPAAS